MKSSNAAPMGVIILGASSAIAEAVARRLATKGVRLGLVARDAVKLAAIGDDLRIRGAPQIAVRAWDLAAGPAPGALAELAQEMGGADTVLIAYGLLGDQALAEADGAAAWLGTGAANPTSSMARPRADWPWRCRAWLTAPP